MVQVLPLQQASVDDNAIAVSFEARMEEGLEVESIPVAPASICTTDPMYNDVIMATVAALERSNSIPTVVASELCLPPALSSHQCQEDMKRPDLLSATVINGSKDEKDVGLLLANTNGRVIIAGLEQDGMFKASPFQIGDEVVSVNNKSCDHMDAGGVANLIKYAENIVTVVVRAPNGRADWVSAMVRKQRPDSRVGLTLKRRRRNVVISGIAEDGLFAHTLLNVGDTCLSINGIKITPDMDVRASANFILNAPESVTIEAKIHRGTGLVVAVLEESRARIGSNQYGDTVCALLLFIFTVSAIIILLKEIFKG
jgi:S1-C subfamily serine protease